MIGTTAGDTNEKGEGSRQGAKAAKMSAKECMGRAADLADKLTARAVSLDATFPVLLARILALLASWRLPQ